MALSDKWPKLIELEPDNKRAKAQIVRRNREKISIDKVIITKEGCQYHDNCLTCPFDDCMIS